MTGHWTPKQGDAERVPLSWESKGEGHGTIHATLERGGEHFTGEYELVGDGASGVRVHTLYRDWNALPEAPSTPCWTRTRAWSVAASGRVRPPTAAISTSSSEGAPLNDDLSLEQAPGWPM